MMKMHLLAAAMLLGSNAIAAGLPQAGAAAMQANPKETPPQEDSEAQFVRGVAYVKGDGVPKDEKLAAEWLRKAAERGHLKSRILLAAMYREGVGVAKDEVQAVHWTREAAAQGDAAAQYSLAMSYATGAGLAKDEQRAAIWFLRAAEQGHARAQMRLGVIFGKGTGVPQDTAQAIAWLHKAVEQGEKSAIRPLALAYSLDLADPALSAQRSYLWLLIAAANGDMQDEELRGKLEKALPKQTLESLRAEAAAWKPSQLR
jgi:TPR repeat protein